MHFPPRLLFPSCFSPWLCLFSHSLSLSLMCCRCSHCGQLQSTHWLSIVLMWACMQPIMCDERTSSLHQALCCFLSDLPIFNPALAWSVTPGQLACQPPRNSPECSRIQADFDLNLSTLSFTVWPNNLNQMSPFSEAFNTLPFISTSFDLSTDAATDIAALIEKAVRISITGT